MSRILRYYQHVIGYYVPTKPEEPFREELDVLNIVIKVGSFMLWRLKEYPLHASQQCDESKGLVTIRVVETPELYSTLMSYGQDIEVLEPVSVREKLKKRFVSALNIYNDSKAKKDDDGRRQ